MTFGHVSLAIGPDCVEHRLLEPRADKDQSQAENGARNQGKPIVPQPPDFLSGKRMVGHDAIATRADQLGLTLHLYGQGR